MDEGRPAPAQSRKATEYDEDDETEVGNNDEIGEYAMDHGVRPSWFVWLPKGLRARRDV